MISVSWAVMAHPARAAFIPELLEWLGDPDMPVVWDRKNDRWDTGRRAQLAFDPACSHHAVIQDDVLPCRDLVAALPEILEHVDPQAPLCGYVGTVRPSLEQVNAVCNRARVEHASFIRMHTLNWGPLVVTPTTAIEEMIAYCDPLGDIPNYDRRMSRYWELSRGIWTWYAWPSLVDHRDGPSLVPGRMGTFHRQSANRRGSRVAHSFLGFENSALSVDWSGPVVSANRGPERYAGMVCVTFRHKHAGRELTIPVDHPRARILDRNPSWERVKA